VPGTGVLRSKEAERLEPMHGPKRSRSADEKNVKKVTA